MISVNLIVEEKRSCDIYRSFLTSRHYAVNEVFVLEKNDEIIIEHSNSLVLIDIATNQGLQDLSKLKLNQHAIVIIISPIPAQLFTLPKNLKNHKSFFISKPINTNKLEHILQEAKISIEKKEYLQHKEQLLVQTIDNSIFRIAIYDLEGNMLYANSAYIEANNITDVYNTKFQDIINCQNAFKDIVYNLKINGMYVTQREHNKKWYKSYFYFADNNTHVVHFCNEITAEKKLFDSLRKSANFFEHSNEGVVITDHKGTIQIVNNSFCNITGYTKDDAIGKSTKLLKSGIHDKAFYDNLWDSLRHHGKWQGEIWNKRKNGEIYPEWLSITKMKDLETNEINYMAIFTDITSLKDADKKLHFYANHDHLTGLLNKVQFENMLQRILNSAVRNNKKFALMFIDLDHFKEVNDTAGHDVGDKILKEVSRRLQKSLRKEDIVARIGGDEFNVIIDDVQEESDVLLLANKLNDEIKKPFVHKEKVFYLSLSVGITIFPYHGLNITELSKNADAAMYEVKNNGRNGVLTYNKKFTQKLMKNITIYHDLKEAIKNEKLMVYYQLVFDAYNNNVIGAEALVRWKHETKGFISPEDFIKVAEHHGLIQEIDRFVATKALEDLTILLNRFGKDFVMAINVSSKEFLDEQYVTNLLQLINDFHINSKNIEVEITETNAMKNQEIAISRMQELQNAGISIAIDDFGTGYSSLSYLKKFPANKLKIDRSFINDILHDHDDKNMVKAIIEIAKIFDLVVQAEGIETAEHLEYLKEIGIDVAQGYYHARPMPIEEILIHDWNKEL